MNRSHRSLVAAVALAVFLLPAVARAQLLQFVPQDALLVVKVNNLQQFSQQISGLARAAGLDKVNPILGGDPLMMVQGMTGMTGGLNKGGDGAWVLLNVEGQEPTFLSLVPVSDYQAFLKNFGEAQVEGEVSQVVIQGEDVYASQWGDFAAISNQKAVVQQQPTGLQVEGPVQKELDGNDFTVYLNMPALKDKVLPMLQMQREMLRTQFVQGLQANPEAQEFQPAIESLFDQVMDAVEGFFNNTQALTYGVDLDQKGVKSSFVAAFNPGTYPANLVQKIDGTQEPLAASLPNLNYIIWGGYAVDPEVSRQLVGDLVSPVVTELKPLGEEIQPLVNYLEAMVQMMGAVNQQAFGLIEPTAPLGEEPLYQLVAITEGDTKTIVESQRKMFEAQKQMPLLAGGGQMEADVTYTPGATTIAGVKLDRFEADLNLDAQNPQEAQAQQQLDWLYGPGGPSGYTGTINENLQIFTMGASDDVVEQLIQAARAEGATTQPEAQQQVAERLPQNRFAAVYFAPDTLLATVLRYAQQMGLPMQLQVPEGLPPVGATLATEETAVRADSYVSAELIKGLVDVGTQAQAMFGGMGGGMEEFEDEDMGEDEGMEEEEFEDLGADEGGL